MSDDERMGDGSDGARAPGAPERASGGAVATTGAAATTAGAGLGGLGAVRDISVTMSLEVGRVRMTIEELLRLGEGSVVELERFADEPLDVLVNDTLVARGEAVVVGERFGIRLTEVVAGTRLPDAA